LVLLHGFSGRPEAWQEVVSHLERPGLVVAPCLPGHDSIPPAWGWESFEQAVRGLAEAVRSIHPGGWRLAGYSLGARLALGLMVAAPDLWTDALVVGVNPGLESEAERLARRCEDKARALLLREDGVEAFVDGWERLPLFDSQRSVAAERLAVQRAQRLAHDPEPLARSLEVLGLGAMPDFWPALASIVLPVQVAVGELDLRFREIAVRVASRLPAGRLVVVPGVGHNVVLEAPETVARLLEGGAACDCAEPEEGS
jgi:2-succinyl-6-hydroxy-2,4-cyclohexadiene-1-carboxylate synthase